MNRSLLIRGFNRTLFHQVRSLTTSMVSSKKLNFPLTPDEMPRSGGISTMMRLPYEKSAKGLDACFVGIPFDAGASNRVGTRFGPRQIRSESSMLRPYNPATGAAPFESLMVADVGDISVNTFNIKDSMKRIQDKIRAILDEGCRPLILGGDHTISYPILKAIKEKHGPVGLVHIDAHSDTSPSMYGEDIFHGSPFYHAAEEGLLDCKRVVQIGLRGSWYDGTVYSYATEKGFRVVPAHECWYKSLEPLMSEVRQQMGDGPVYISFDIDGLDPAFAPGTGTPEIGGLTSIQGLEIIRGCQGLQVVGGDVVEVWPTLPFMTSTEKSCDLSCEKVSPPYDPLGTTALHGANLLFEMLCVLPGVKILK
ncbi:hypothetical protein QZH41_010186 [Actinostola sp. cb2023]|nr:hypothetical protein QZH41_010186 [Actinostola sp. cb2023]